MARRVVDVLVPVALNQTYSYRVPDGVDLNPGDVVNVPLGPREVTAVVWAENPNPDPRLHNRLKDTGDKLDVPPLKPELRSFVDWVATYTLSARGMVLRMTLRMGDNLGPERTRMGVRLIGEPPRRLTPARRRLLDVLSDGLLHGKSEAAKEAGVSGGVTVLHAVDSRPAPDRPHAGRGTSCIRPTGSPRRSRSAAGSASRSTRAARRRSTRRRATRRPRRRRRPRQHGRQTHHQ